MHTLITTAHLSATNKRATYIAQFSCRAKFQTDIYNAEPQRLWRGLVQAGMPQIPSLHTVCSNRRMICGSCCCRKGKLSRKAYPLEILGLYQQVHCVCPFDVVAASVRRCSALVGGGRLTRDRTGCKISTTMASRAQSFANTQTCRP